MKINFEYVTSLQYEVRTLRAQIKAYESGEAYHSMKAECDRQLREKDRIIVIGVGVESNQKLHKNCIKNAALKNKNFSQ